PGARLVFTWGGTLRPFSTAFLAKRPAAIITLGLLVFVQLVMAAITTSPCLSGNLLPFTWTSTPAKPGSALAAAGSALPRASGSILWPPSPSQRPSGVPLLPQRLP